MKITANFCLHLYPQAGTLPPAAARVSLHPAFHQAAGRGEAPQQAYHEPGQDVLPGRDPDGGHAPALPPVLRHAAQPGLRLAPDLLHAHLRPQDLLRTC